MAAARVIGELVVDGGPFDWRLGRVVDGELEQLRVIDRVGGIEDVPFLARAEAFAPELGGLFVDIGREASVFVRLPARQRRAPPAQGRPIVVQGVRDPMLRKAGRATMRLRLDGAFMAHRAELHAPTAVDTLPADRRRALEARAHRLFPGASVMLFETAEQASDTALFAEATILVARSAEIVARASTLRPPVALIDEHQRLEWALSALLVGVDRIVCREIHRLYVVERCRAAGIENDVVAASDPWAAAGVEGGADEASMTELVLDNGAALVVEHTQAVVAVDVDRRSATGPITAINTAAIDALARAIRVRELSGQIVVDFLEPARSEGRASLEAALKGRLAPLDVQVITVLGSGLAVLERPQRRIPLAARRDPTREAGDALLRHASRRARIRVRVATDIDDMLARPAYARATKAWLARAGTTLERRRDPSLAAGTWIEEE